MFPMRARPVPLALLAAAAISVAALALAIVWLTTGSSQVSAGPPSILIVDDDNPSCSGAAPGYSSVKLAVDAALSGDTVRVCAGVYVEPTIQVNKSLTITGPGATPQNDGVATIQKALASSSAMISITGDDVTVEGIDWDATKPIGFTAQTGGFEVGVNANNVIIQDNEIRNTDSSSAISTNGANGQARRNYLHDNGDNIVCFCTNFTVSDNTVEAGDTRGIDVNGAGGLISGNVVTDGDIRGNGDNVVIHDNQVLGYSGGNIMTASGNPLTISDNLLTDGDFNGLQVRAISSSTNATIVRNTFLRFERYAIKLNDANPADANTLDALIGGSPADANVFRDSAGTLVDTSYLLEISYRPRNGSNINAEHNDWGLCSLAEIEMEVYHQVDDALLGLVDFDPFVEPACETPTPTPTPPAGESVVWGDVDCDGTVGTRDSQAILRNVLEQPPLSQTGDCPLIGAPVKIDGNDGVWGDVDCDGTVGTRDSQAILRNVLEQPALSQTQPCPLIGSPT